MPVRDSRQSCCDVNVASHFVSAHKKVFGTVPFVHVKYRGLFLALEDDLRDGDIPCREYAYTVVRTLHRWAVGKGFNSVPVRVFCGNWAMKKFMKSWKSKTVKIDTVEDDQYTRLLGSELFIAREYIARNLGENPIRMKQIVIELKDFVDEVWYGMYDNGNASRPTDDVIDILCEEYGIKRVYSYNDIIDAVIRQRTGKWKRHTRLIAVSD